MEKANHVAAQRFWRTLPDDVTVEEAQALLDTWCATRGDVRMRATADGRATVAAVAEAEPLRPDPGARTRPSLTVARAGVRAGAGVLPREPVLRPAGAGRGHA